MHKKQASETDRRLLTRFRDGARIYERRYVRCGKPTCGTCAPGAQAPGGHGPYWYLCAAKAGAWRRVYLGKTLSTEQFIRADGEVDWEAVDAKRQSRERVQGDESEGRARAPGPTCGASRRGTAPRGDRAAEQPGRTQHES